MFAKLLAICLCGLSVDAGVVYTRWGRKDCPGNAKLVYAGVAGGGHHTHVGGGSSLECMSLEPEFSDTDMKTVWPTYIYGSEYEIHGPGGTDNSLWNHNIPCAVCRVGPRSTQIMIPGRMTCTGAKWTKEYSGKLATGYHSHQGQKPYVCLDLEMESGDNGATNSDGALLYLIQGACGSLPCPPYMNHREINCVVCSK